MSNPTRIQEQLACTSRSDPLGQTKPIVSPILGAKEDLRWASDGVTNCVLDTALLTPRVRPVGVDRHPGLLAANTCET